MRPLMCSGAWRAFLALSVIAACETPAPSAPPTPTVVSSTPARAQPNLAMGTGEARNPEPFTVEQRLLDAVRRNDKQTIERALARGASIHSKDDIGRNPVFLAVLDAGDLELTRWLHEKGAAIDDADSGGRTPLSFAAAHGRRDLVHYLLAQGAAVDRDDIQQRTPLFHAALNDARDVAAFLLERGANVNHRDQFGDTPLIVACAKGYGAMATLLLQRGADAEG